MDEHRVRFNMSDAYEKKLPAIGFSFDRAGSGMTVEKFPEEGCYIRLSRPPQGSTEFLVYAYQDKKHGYEILERMINRHFSDNEDQPLKLGRRTKLKIGGKKCQAKIYMTGRGISKRMWVGAIMPSSRGSPQGLFMAFGSYTSLEKVPDDIGFIMSDELQKIADSFRIEESD